MHKSVEKAWANKMWLFAHTSLAQHFASGQWGSENIHIVLFPSTSKFFNWNSLSVHWQGHRGRISAWVERQILVAVSSSSLATWFRWILAIGPTDTHERFSRNIYGKLPTAEKNLRGLDRPQGIPVKVVVFTSSLLFFLWGKSTRQNKPLFLTSPSLLLAKLEVTIDFGKKAGNTT